MSLKFCVFASGSKGNCCYVSDGKTDILIDLGISATRAEQCLKALGAKADGATVVVTHAHSDHVGGLKVFCGRHPTARVYCQRECALGVGAASGITPQTADRELIVGGLTVTAFAVSHDVPCFGYIVSDGQKRIAVATDIGKVTGEQLAGLGACDIVMLEANHDLNKLAANPRYTSALKARIRSDRGHLSNADCAAACAYLASGGVKNFVLAHLSEENNSPELAVSLVKRYIEDGGTLDARVIAAKQNSMSGLFEIC